MTRIDKVKDILKQMTEDERLELIRLCNVENDKLKIDKMYLQLNNNHHCPHCSSNKICKNYISNTAPTSTSAPSGNVATPTAHLVCCAMLLFPVILSRYSQIKSLAPFATKC